MKYLILFIFLITFSNAITCNTFKFTYQDVFPSVEMIGGKLYCNAISGNVWTNQPDTNPCKMVKFAVTTTTVSAPGVCPSQPSIPIGTNSSACYVDYTTNPISFKCNGKPSDNVSPSLRCDQAYISNVDGSVKACNPNTNISSVIPNAIGGTYDKDGSLQVICAKGYAADYLPNMGDNISYDTVSCILEPEKPVEPIIIIKPDGEKVVTNPDGSTVVTKVDGTIVSTDKEGIVSTSYPNGSGSISGSYGSSNGTSGVDSSSEIIIDKSIGANTPLESNTTGSIDYVPIAVASFCGDPSMTLEQKNLCEINQGIKNLNAESSPSNSTSNLLKDINQDNNSNASAINQNIKYTNDNLELINRNTIASNHNTANVVKGVAKQTEIAEQQLAQDKLNGKTLESIDTTTKKILENSDFFKSSIQDSLYDDDTNIVKMHSAVQSMKDNQGLIMSTINNISDAYTSATENYEEVKAKLTGDTLTNSFSVPQATNLPVMNLRVFGIDKQMTCFFNQDLYALFSGIRPFLTFMLNVYFVYLSIKIYFNLVTRLA